LSHYIPYARQDIDENDIQTVVQILKSDWLTQGPVILEFENTCARSFGAEYAIAVNSATSALHLACLALGVGSGDWVWTSPNTFVASANCALYCGAQVDFVDIDPLTYNFSAKAFAEKLEEAKKENKIPKAIVVVHFAGQPCEMQEIKQLADRYQIKIIEDASHAIGATYFDTQIGACQYSDITIFSFHPVKIFTTGEGGMVLTNSKEIMSTVQRLRTHGITRDPDLMEKPCPGDWYYEQLELGFNYRMTEIQAALGLSQLARLPKFIEKRHQIAKRYDTGLSHLPVILPFQSKKCQSAYHLYPVLLKLEEIGLSRKAVFDSFRKANIGVNVHYIPVHRQPYYQKLGFKRGDFPVAESYYEKTISLPMYYALTEKEQDSVMATFDKILAQ
jgi:UDP-4-amino-4,6-dideoxy-N-acetyl-beta-L-altrosamine transaminase